MTSPIKVLVVDDSAFMRKLISDFLKGDSRFQVVATARDGLDAIKKVKQFQPDVVTLDIEMPEMNGLDALKVIMSENPTRVVMLSSTTQEGAENTVTAIEYGAVDFIAKPSGAISLDLHKIKGEILTKILMASKANIRGVSSATALTTNTQIANKLDSKETSIVKQDGKPIVGSMISTGKKLLCIGTSTGGPRALQQVLTKLPATIDAPILIVQHMPAGFTKSLAIRLDTLCAIRVKEAEDGDTLQKGTAYIAPGGYHLKVKSVGSNLNIYLDSSDPRNGHRPAVDVMFESIAQLKGYEKVAVIMTGMGSDGTLGLKALKNSGSTIAIAESEESSIVFGMPKSAIATNLVDEVEHLEKISSTILKYINA
ncbi:protein-glutamate methylesterase/protein-glutamine glutaminase [Calidifontibacillus oryziterrae]|uniref:protein-glutamate methylesterase/protein-glutamine glutaminase n=1 Tax=Calidifontibacillus oryziterrae TaxID=1191699 RepID=UPI0002E1F958|nr:chemotaxis response regulator protein-glutamate methylesterase [Calidifontibacillus oryziterrae]